MTPVLVLLLAVPSLAPARLDAPPTKPTAEPKTVAELLNTVRWYRLPLPPKHAPFVKWVTTSEEVDNAGVVRKVPYSNFAFVLFPQVGPRSASVLVGDWIYEFDERIQGSWSRVRPVIPTPALLDEEHHLRGELVLLAAQFAANGWAEMAAGTLDRAKRELGHEPVLSKLRHEAWQYAERQLTEPGTDRAAALAVLKDIAADDERFRHPGHVDLVVNLERTLRPRTSRPGSVVALLDDLTDWHEPFSSGFHWHEDNVPFRQLVERGFDAVPTLIEHLTDRRLTRTLYFGGNNFRPYITRVSHVVTDVLDELSAGQIRTVGAGRLSGWALPQAEALRWWGKARAVGEEKWVFDHVLPADKKDEHPSRGLLILIRAKYPKRLPELYRTLLRNRPHVRSYYVVEEVLAAGLPPAETVPVLVEATRHDRYFHRDPALDALQRLDRAEFRPALQATLEWLPPDVAGEYGASGESDLTVYATRVDDPECWAALTAATKRAAVGLKFELLGATFGEYRPSPGIARPARLQYLASFLDDPAVRDVTADNEKYRGLHTAEEYPRIAIRDFAALKLAEALKINVPVKPDCTPAEWAALRDRVTAALAAERKRTAK